ncbi:MAG: protein kinase [Actinomycetota bacterium]|nr:protein kinase [Actinomycetota bacterium]
MALDQRVWHPEPAGWHGIQLDQDPVHLLLERRVPWMIHEDVFSSQSFGIGAWPDQGWKLHISATPVSAVEVLDRALDVLVASGTRFKVVSSLNLLAAMNSGAFGATQIGKFITVYPTADADAVQLAVALDRATHGRAGPRVPSDRPLRQGSLVHYRYGSFRLRPESITAEHADGGYDLLDPDGRLMEDVRLTFYRPPPDGIIDPFETAGVRITPPPRSRLLHDRYLVVDAMGQSARGGVFRAVDVGVRPARLCLVKEYWHDVGLDAYGRDARDWAVNEQHILTRLTGDPALPCWFDSFEQDGDSYLVIEYVEGTSLDRVIAERDPIRNRLELSDVIAVGLATADALAHLHEKDIIFRDFKPANVIQTPEGGYRLIDFGIAYECRRTNSPPLSIGSPPFYPPEQYRMQTPAPTDDVFAWGAVLHYLAAGEVSIESMSAQDDFLEPFRRKPVRQLNASLPAAVAEVIDRAVAWTPAERYQSMRAAHAALARAAPQGAVDVTIERAISTAAPPPPPPMSSATALALACDVGDALCRNAVEESGGLCWERRFERSERTERGPDLYGGAAGVGLFLAELGSATGDERYLSAARGAARWLSGPVWGRGRSQHGFHNGEAGIAYFLLRLADLLEQPGYVDAAVMRLRRLRGATCPTVDLMYGSAGTMLGSLACHAVTGEAEFLRDARTIGDHLLTTALPLNGADGCCWEVLSAFPGGPVAPYLGLLHGSAGIGLALAQLADRTGDERYLRTTKAVAEHLKSQGIPATGRQAVDGVAIAWPASVGEDRPRMQAQCHGAGGIGQFFLRLDRLVPDPSYQSTAQAAARAVIAQSCADTSSGICHGISGAGHLMLDCYQASGQPQWRTFAYEFAHSLAGFRVPDEPGKYFIQEGQTVSPDLMIGYAGVGSFLLRLANPADAPDPILGRLPAAGNAREWGGNEGVRENAARASRQAE